VRDREVVDNCFLIDQDGAKRISCKRLLRRNTLTHPQAPGAPALVKSFNNSVQSGVSSPTYALPSSISAHVSSSGTSVDEDCGSV
jgi:hypothetical protein